MNIFYKVTAQSLWKNRTRTMVTIVGIILSAAMITAVTSLVSSFQDYLYRMTAYENGNWYTHMIGVSHEDKETLEGDEKIDLLYGAQMLGYARTESTNPDKPYLYILGMGEGFAENMPIRLLTGRLPENASEILLPMHLQSNGEVEILMGSQLTLEVGKRTSDGWPLTQHTMYLYEEEGLEDIQSRTYTVVGIYERPDFEEYSAPGYTALTGWDESYSAEKYEVYFTTVNPKDAYLWPNEEMDYGGTYNDQLLLMAGASMYSGYFQVLYGFAAVIIVLILFGSVSLIYNAFSISVSDRTKQFGLLSSIGATKRQLRSSVIFEAMVVGCIGVPLGIIFGIMGIGITLQFIGGYFTTFLYGDITEEIKVVLHVSWQSVLIAWIIGMGTVLISAWIPAKRAMKVSAVEAIRSSQDVKVSRKEVRVSKLNYWLFGLEGLLAKKYFKRDKKKYRATVISLFMSIVLFISASAFIMYLTGTVDVVMEQAAYDITYFSQEDEYREEFEELCAVEGVEDGLWIQRYYGDVINVPQESISDLYRQWIGVDETVNVSLGGTILFMDEASFNEYIKSIGEDPGKYADPAEPQGILWHSRELFVNEKYQQVEILDEVPSELILRYYGIPVEGSEEYKEVDLTFRIGSVQAPMEMVGGGECTLVYCESMREAVLGELSEVHIGNSSIKMFFGAKHAQKAFEQMQGILAARGMDINQLYNEQEDSQNAHNVVVVINVLSYGFIALISLIAVTNVFNTISTNVILRRRDFAMLRSVGLTQKGFNRMMSFECIMYGVKALILGLPVSFLMNLWIHNITSAGWESELMIPWHAIFVAVASVFVVVFASMMYALRKIRRENLMDALKNEIQ
ncbi:MAG: ABC transporter permease [Firmicutes bacterium]|nr:ABC transporter permease [Bacillota bacterium]